MMRCAPSLEPDSLKLFYSLPVCFSLIHKIEGGRAERQGPEFGQGLQKIIFFLENKKLIAMLYTADWRT